MALNIFKYNCLTPLHIKGLTQFILHYVFIIFYCQNVLFNFLLLCYMLYFMVFLFCFILILRRRLATSSSMHEDPGWNHGSARKHGDKKVMGRHGICKYLPLISLSYV